VGSLDKIKTGFTILGAFFDPNYLTHRSLYRLIKDISKRFTGGRLLDFGCGNKPYQELFANRVDRYDGVDIEQSGHDHTNESIDYFWDGKTLPFENESYDHVISTEVFEHVFEIDNTLNEINRVMKVGADGIFTVPFAWEEHEKPYDYGRYSHFGLEYLLNKHGFEVVDRRKSGTYIQTIYQMKCCYWEKKIFIKVHNTYLYHLLVLLIAAPVTLRGLFWSLVLPDSDELYMDNVVYIRKIRDI